MDSFSDLLAGAQLHQDQLLSGGVPWIRVGTAVCGEAAGALAVVESLKSEISKRNIPATISEVGCIGLCYAETIVDILKPGKPRVFYAGVTVEMVPGLVEAYLQGDDHRPDIAMAYSGEGHVEGVPRLEDLPMWNRQVRVAMRNCGHIDPTDIRQYIANGGYAALNKALTQMQPEDVLKEV